MPAANATSESVGAGGWTGVDRLVFLLLVAAAMLRSLAIILSPLELGVDEAQYWLWSTEFDFGYYTKPPLTSWIIGASHQLFGHHVWAVRLPAPWLHLVTALVLWRAAAWFAGPVAGPVAGRLAALLWTCLPAVALGSFVISTDTPLLLFWSLGLLALVGGVTGRVPVRRAMMFAGGAFGIAFLGKYAAIYGLAGVLLFWGLDRLSGARVFSPASVLIFVISMGVVASPNLLWNLANDFTTVRHLGDNANLDRQSLDPLNSLRFLGAQFATAGPVVFALMFTILWPGRSGTGRDRAGGLLMRRLLICLSVPVIAVIMIQAFLSEANANWALAAMPALVIWLASWLAGDGQGRWRARLGGMALVINAGLSVIILVVTLAGTLGPLTPQSDPLRRQRGWQQLATDTQAALTRHEATTVIADRRASAALLSWHFHGAGLTVLVHDEDGRPSNHFEQNLAWSHQPGRRLIRISDSIEPPRMDHVVWNLARQPGVSATPISRNRTRSLYLHQGVEAD